MKGSLSLCGIAAAQTVTDYTIPAQRCVPDLQHRRCNQQFRSGCAVHVFPGPLTLGRKPRRVFVIQLREAVEEWRRRRSLPVAQSRPGALESLEPACPSPL
jgi:hypothetical protein